MCINEFVQNIQNTFSKDETVKKAALDNLNEIHQQGAAIWSSLYNGMKNRYEEQEQARRA